MNKYQFKKKRTLVGIVEFQCKVGKHILHLFHNKLNDTYAYSIFSGKIGGEIKEGFDYSGFEFKDKSKCMKQAIENYEMILKDKGINNEQIKWINKQMQSKCNYLC